MATIKIDTKSVKKYLRGIVERSKDLSPVMKYIGTEMRNQTLKNFDKEQSYDGIAWKKSKRALKEGGKTLQNTGRLRNSIKFKSFKNKAVVGTNVKYAKTLQNGWDELELKEVNIKSHKRKIYRRTKSGRRSKRGIKVIVRAHKRKMKIPFGIIPKYKFMGITKEQEEKYRDRVLRYIVKGE